MGVVTVRDLRAAIDGLPEDYVIDTSRVQRYTATYPTKEIARSIFIDRAHGLVVIRCEP